MKKRFSSILKALQLVTLVAILLPLCSCQPIDTTIFMDEAERAEYLNTKSKEYINPQKYHNEYDITVSIFGGEETESYNVVFEEYYDQTASSEAKYMIRESRNDFTEYTDCATFVDGIMYLSSEYRKVRSNIVDMNEMFSYLNLYFINVEEGFPVLHTCPPMKDGQYLHTQIATQPQMLTSLYGYLYWAIPADLYGKLMIDSFRSESVFDSRGRLLQCTTFIKISDPNNKTRESVTVKYMQTPNYEDFEITAPDDVEAYYPLNDYRAAYDTLTAIYAFLGEQSGSFDLSFNVDLNGAINTTCSISNAISYSTSSDGIPTFTVESQSVNHDGIKESTVTTYDGVNLISRSAGKHKQTPTSPEEAYYILYDFKDFLRLYDGAFDTVTKYSDCSNSYREIGFTLKDEFSSSILTNELYYFFGITPDTNSLTPEANCTVRVLCSPNGDVADEITLLGNATFKTNGETVNMTYEYKMKVLTHTN